MANRHLIADIFEFILSFDIFSSTFYLFNLLAIGPLVSVNTLLRNYIYSHTNAQKHTDIRVCVRVCVYTSLIEERMFHFF